MPGLSFASRGGSDAATFVFEDSRTMQMKLFTMIGLAAMALGAISGCGSDDDDGGGSAGTGGSSGTAGSSGSGGTSGSSGAAGGGSGGTSGSSGAAGGGGTAGSGGAAGGSGDEVCDSAPDATACFNCCTNTHPESRTALLNLASSCVCRNDQCATECANYYCASTPMVPPMGDACETCVNGTLDPTSGTCFSEVASACQADADCNASTACAMKYDCMNK